jgi:hypothetical protein
MTIMGGIAEFERGLIRKRCDEGILRAKRKGTKFGRPTALDPSQRRRIAERYTGGETMAELAREYECGEATICKRFDDPLRTWGRRLSESPGHEVFDLALWVTVDDSGEGFGEVSDGVDVVEPARGDDG